MVGRLVVGGDRWRKRKVQPGKSGAIDSRDEGGNFKD